MEWFLIFLAISLTASEKLDRTYLPPPGAQFAGGNPDDIQAPFETSDISQPVNIGLDEFGSTGQPTQTTPVTTTSYAFTQTTTYPSIESYETTAVPINLVTGLPILDQNGQQQYSINLPGFIQSQSNGVPSYGTNVQTGSLNQFPNQIITPGGLIQIPDSISPSLEQSLAHHGQPNSQIVTSQNVISPGTPVVGPGSTSLVPSNNQGLTEYPSEINTLQDQFSETAYQGVQPGHASQGIYSKQPIIVPDAGLPQYNQGYQNEGQPILQQFSENQNKVGPGSDIGQNIYTPSYHHDGIPSTAPGFPSTVSANASINDNIINRPERPQAEADRHAVIINYENVRTPNGYSYSYDTSNGIHADEIGTVGDGTKAQGSYSYIGDDGKVYSVTYTADENGFQPHGDHLPTPPPIPEAIQKVIEQAARDEVAGVIDDGSYDEVKYGHDQYQRPMSNYHPQIKDRLSLENNRKIKPITGITEDDYYEDEPQDHLNLNEQIGTISDSIRKLKNNDDNSHNTGPNYMEKNNFGLKKQGTFAQYPDSKTNNLPNSGDYNFNDRNIEPKDGQPILPHTVGSASQIGTDYPGSQIEDIDESDIYLDGKEGLIPESDYKNGQFEHPRTDHGSYSQDNGFPPISNGGQNTKQKPKGRRPGISSNKIYTKDKRPQSYQTLDQENVGDFGEIQKDDFSPSQQENIKQVNDNGYHYNSPQNQFPSRFNVEKNYSTPRPLGKSTTLRPFVTSEVHNQPSDVRLNANRQNYNTKPFMTSSVTTPKEGPYTDYDGGDDYDIDQNIGEYSTTRKPSGPTYVGTRRRLQPAHTTSKPQYTPSGQRIRVDQKEPVSPDHKIDYSVTPSYIHSSTTPIPPQNTRFGSTEIRRRPLESHRPSTSVAPGSLTVSMKPGLKTFGLYEDRPEPRPVSGYPDSIVPGLGNEARPSYGSRILAGQKGSTLQSYPLTSTTIRPVTRPANKYSDTSVTPASVNVAGPSYGSRIPSGQRVTTIIPTTLGYQPGLGPLIPSGTLETIRQPTDDRNKYQYTFTTSPQIPKVSGTKTFYPTTSELIDYSVTTSRPSPDRQGIPQGPGTTVSAPVDAYQTGYQYEPPKIVSNDGSLINTGPLGSYVSQTSPSDYEYGTPGPVYSTTLSPSTIGTTPASLTQSTIPGRLPQTYSTTQQPSYTSTQNIYDQTPLVDGFGRPIPSEYQTRFSSPGHDVNQRPGIFVTGEEDRKTPDRLNTGQISQPSPTYPGYYDQPKIIGEDFTGPKQPQRFDPQTGYHYK